VRSIRIDPQSYPYEKCPDCEINRARGLSAAFPGLRFGIEREVTEHSWGVRWRFLNLETNCSEMSL
jgi:hypothetical protein